jgi:transglutaminase-like putative cysteine protease
VTDATAAPDRPGRRSTLAERIRQANAPRPPESSARLRVASGAAIVVALAAAASEHDLSRPGAALSAVLVGTGMAFSHRTRERSSGLVKGLVAVAALAAMAWFIDRLYQAPLGGGLVGVEGPLTVLLAWIMIVHSFHVPARRDLVFSLAGSAALMAVAAAAAIDMSFGWYGVVWAACGLWALVEIGAAAAEGARPGAGLVARSVAMAVVVGIVAFLALPAPSASIKLDFRTNPGPAGPEPNGGVLAGDSGRATQLSRPGTTSGPTRVGGYLGFAGSLNTGVRAELGNQLVMQVRASVPSYWVGETYDRWDGQNWSSTLRTGQRNRSLGGGSPFVLPYAIPSGTNDIQTFYLNDVTADLVFHADDASEVWVPSSSVYFDAEDDSITSATGLGKGAIYTVESSASDFSPDVLRQAPAVPADDPAMADYLELPPQQPYTRVRELARSVTAADDNEYDTVQSLISWIGANTRYSTDIPPLPAGADAVDEFLFGNRVGYCEQISTALTIMLRTLGIPARETVGYVPGSYNPVTDLYQVRADDAHAWVQVDFPGYGWVSFDPTASVPAANPSPGSVAVRDAIRFVAGLPWVRLAAPLVAVAGAGAVIMILRRRRAAGRLSPAERAVRRMERAGARAGRARAPSETVTEYGAALAGGWPGVACAVDRSAYGGAQIPADEWRRLLAEAEAESRARV